MGQLKSSYQDLIHAGAFSSSFVINPASTLTMIFIPMSPQPAEGIDRSQRKAAENPAQIHPLKRKAASSTSRLGGTISIHRRFPVVALGAVAINDSAPSTSSDPVSWLGLSSGGKSGSAFRESVGLRGGCLSIWTFSIPTTLTAQPDWLVNRMTKKRTRNALDLHIVGSFRH